MKKKYLKDNKELMLQYNFAKNKDLQLNELTLGSDKKIWWKYAFICRTYSFWTGY